MEVTIIRKVELSMDEQKKYEVIKSLADVNTSRREMEMSNRINEQKPMRKRGIGVIAGVDTRVAHLRAEVADLLETLLDLIGRLGVHFVSLVIGYIKIMAQTFPICYDLETAVLYRLAIFLDECIQ